MPGGGDIVFGIVDRPGADNQSTGIADSLSGIKLLMSKLRKDRLLNLIRDGIRSTSDRDCDALRSNARTETCWCSAFLAVGTSLTLVTIDGVNSSIYAEEQRNSDESKRNQEGVFRAERIWGNHRKMAGDRAELASKGKGPVRLAGDVKWLFHVIPASAFSRDVLRESWTVCRTGEAFRCMFRMSCARAGTTRTVSVPGGYRRSIHSLRLHPTFSFRHCGVCGRVLLQLATNWWASDDLRSGA